MWKWWKLETEQPCNDVYASSNQELVGSQLKVQLWSKFEKVAW